MLSDSSKIALFRRIKALASTVAVVGLALLPTCGALFDLGTGLAGVERLRRAGEGTGALESIGTYEVNPTTLEATMRFHSTAVRR